jgi:folate-binding protein YgfZ
MTTPQRVHVLDAGTLVEVGGHSVVLTYSSVGAEYEALRTRAVVVDRSQRARTRISGARAAETLTGLVTNDVAALELGHGQYAAALTPKGKIVADVRVFRDDDGLLVDTGARAAEGWTGVLRKYVNPRLAPYRDESATLRDVGIFGPNARHVVATVTGASAAALGVLPLYGHATVAVDGARVLVARVPDLAVEGFELFVPGDAFDTIWRLALDAGAEPAGLAAWEVARVEAGRPEWGLDMDDTTIAQEANLDELHAISYTKGCYTGQEVVARVHFRGHVNRHLRGLRTAGGEPPPPSAQLVDDSGRPVGEVRSAVASPRLGGIALAMIRREVEVGAPVSVRWDGGEARADVSALPFPS